MSGETAPAATNAADRCPPGWKDPVARPAVAPGCVHVWRVRLDEPGWHTGRMAALLDAGERQRASRLATERHRREFAAGRAALRTILAAYADVPDPASLAFAADESGKPSLAAPDRAARLSFNMSHSGGVALVAVADGAALGVDVERLRPGVAIADIARRQFDVRVTRALLVLDGSRQPAAFLRCWCALEARLKAVGTGFSGGRDVMAEMGLPDALLATLDADTWTGVAGRWRLAALDAGEGYGAVVAADAAVVGAPGGWLTTFRACPPF